MDSHLQPLSTSQKREIDNMWWKQNSISNPLSHEILVIYVIKLRYPCIYNQNERSPESSESGASEGEKRKLNVMQDEHFSRHSFVFASGSLRLILEDWKPSRRSQDEIIAQKHIAIMRNKETYGSY